MEKFHEVSQTSSSGSCSSRLSILKKLHSVDICKSTQRPEAPKSTLTEEISVSKKDESKERFAVPALPKACPTNGSGNSAGSNMRKLLDDLNQSRISIEQDQKAYQKARREIEVADKKISELRLESKKGEDKWNKLITTMAEKKTELTTVEIRNQIVDESIKMGEKELANILEELHRTRMESSELASSYLSDSINFAWLWNGSELGRACRLKHDQVEMANLEQEKRQLDLELEDFLVSKKEVEECERSQLELEQEFNAHDKTISAREKELQEQVDDLDLALLDLQRQKDELVRSSEEEFKMLQRQIQESMKTEVSKLGGTSGNTVESYVDIIDLCSEELKNNSEHQQEDNSSKIGTKSSFQKFTNDSKLRTPTFQAPTVTVKSEPESICNKSNSYYGESFSNSNDEDVDICLAAAEAASQTMRLYEPIKPTPSFTNQRPLPAKVRALERQVPITSYMKQQSSAKTFSSRNSSARGKFNSSRSSSSNSGKVFQFKKKTSSSFEKENINFDCDSLNASSSSFLDQCEVEPEPVCAIEKNSDPSNLPIYTRTSRHDFYDKPYSCFNSSRILLSESQEKLL
ncbi:unnamed protein product [Orchesella dallaii]|uniref:Uncharacterized protein n=1 Tax=Orchesella dallaii TaxID=48710 RepID=A0ABP1R9M1_9HEXA